jgi:hypothetical protein
LKSKCLDFPPGEINKGPSFPSIIWTSSRPTVFDLAFGGFPLETKCLDFPPGEIDKGPPFPFIHWNASWPTVFDLAIGGSPFETGCLLSPSVSKKRVLFFLPFIGMFFWSQEHGGRGKGKGYI